MRHRSCQESVEPFRPREHEAIGHALRDRLENWADEVDESAGKAWPKLPDGIVDRPTEVWEPLLGSLG